MRVVYNVKTKQGDNGSIVNDDRSLQPLEIDTEAILALLNSDTVRIHYNGRILMTRIVGKMYDVKENAFSVNLEEIQ